MGRVHTNFVAILKKLAIAKDWNSVKHFSPTAFDISSSKFLPVKNRAIYLLFCPRTSLTEKHHFGSARFIMNIENKIAPMVSRQVAFLQFSVFLIKITEEHEAESTFLKNKNFVFVTFRLPQVNEILLTVTLIVQHVNLLCLIPRYFCHR